jgi:Domain of unknown function (DUF4159)
MCLLCRQAGAGSILEGPKSDLLLFDAVRDRMRSLRRALLLFLVASLATSVLAYQSSNRQWFGREQFSSSRGSDDQSEFYWSRLQYTSRGGGYGGGGFGFGYGYGYGGSWSRDYPKADRQFLMALKRLTRIQARPYEQVVDLDHDDDPKSGEFPGKSIYNYPWVYAVQVASWTFTDAEAARLREYLLKGGFLMVDDFHGTQDWERFMAGMRMVFPDRPIEDLQDNDEIFHVLYDIGARFQVPGEQYVNTGRTYEKDGYVPKWRAIRDDRGRIMVAICHNMHLGDAWEWADMPEYPENFASMAFRVGLDYIMYGMTH